MLSIWKFALMAGDTVITMPFDAVLLSVAVQHRQLRVWALVDPKRVQRGRRFYVIETGEAVDPIKITNAKFVGTAISEIGNAVVHVYDLGEA